MQLASHLHSTNIGKSFDWSSVLKLGTLPTISHSELRVFSTFSLLKMYVVFLLRSIPGKLRHMEVTKTTFPIHSSARFKLGATYSDPAELGNQVSF